MARVVLEDVVKEFGGVRAADRVSLEIADGEFFTLLGPSGCGKTTTLRLIAGLEFPDAGRIMIGDRDVSRVAPAQRRIAMVFQNYALYPHMTIRENIGYPLKLRKVAPDIARDKISSAASRLGIEKVLDRMPSEISGGQQQRTAVARAMVQDPMVYLFDEPLSNLDARLRLESRRFLKQVLRESRGTAVYVTHDQTEAMALSDRVGVMKDGRLVQVAPPEELYARPASTFVAGFVGNLPMNLIEGEARIESGAWFASDGFRVGLPAGVTVNQGDRLTLGVRPEDIALTAEAPLSGVIEDIEPLGSERIVTVISAGVPLIARVIGDQILVLGQTIGIETAPGRLHLFDAAGARR